MIAKLNRMELLRIAANREKASFALYSRAAVLVGSYKVKKIFQRIARDELAHLFILVIKIRRLSPPTGQGGRHRPTDTR